MMNLSMIIFKIYFIKYLTSDQDGMLRVKVMIFKVKLSSEKLKQFIFPSALRNIIVLLTDNFYYLY